MSEFTKTKSLEVKYFLIEKTTEKSHEHYLEYGRGARFRYSGGTIQRLINFKKAKWFYINEDETSFTKLPRHKRSTKVWVRSHNEDNLYCQIWDGSIKEREAKTWVGSDLLRTTRNRQNLKREKVYGI